MKKLSVALLTLLSSSAVLASDTNESEVNPISYALTIGYTAGGDTLGTLEYEDNSDESIKAGAGIVIGAGLNYTINQNFDVRANGAYHFDSANADNGDVSFNRLSFEVIPYYKLNEYVKLGVGYGVDTSVELDSDFSDDVTFDNAGKLIFSGMYTFEDISASLELRYSSVEYTVSKVGSINVPDNIAKNNQVDGNHFGLLFHWNF
ncbi:hypothetical protein [Pseudoalteromonas sp. T1lg23B]|uniref:hypothetical protein n=1 Tax=Pseudoalteromonas sp. T1lg23B TaxID=2077097 RepID=UPI000CF66FE9|nr:hypothetical protein [Pseudoalteromonas sp. T1lg23B]